MENTVGFYPSDGGSIPSRQTSINAGMVELEYTQDLKSCAERIVGSSPTARTSFCFMVDSTWCAAEIYKLGRATRLVATDRFKTYIHYQNFMPY